MDLFSRTNLKAAPVKVKQHQTFNLAPSLILQLENYASGKYQGNTDIQPSLLYLDFEDNGNV